MTEADEVLQAVSQGIARRVCAGRNAQGYRHPNRAHAVFTMVLMQRSGQDIITSKLQFVDLAGDFRLAFYICSATPGHEITTR